MPEGNPAASKRNLVLAAVAALLVIVVAVSVVFGTTLFGGSSQAKEVHLVVMPLTASGDDPKEAALASGITDELIIRLRRIPDLTIQTGRAADAASDNLPSGNRIEGTLRRDGDKLRLSVRLYDENNDIAWSENFDRQLDDLLQVQEEIAREVAGTLSVALDVGLNSRAYGGTDNPEAYANFVQGLALQNDPETLGRAAIPYLERAVELDPNYIRAHAELVSAYGSVLSLSPRLTPVEAKKLLSQMDDHSSKAFNLAPDLWTGHIARVWFYFASNEIVEADRELHRAEELDPGNDPSLKLSLTSANITMGRIKKAEGFYRASTLIDPINALNGALVSTKFYQGELDDTIREYERLREAGANFLPLYAVQAFWAHALQGDVDGARQVVKENPFLSNFFFTREYDGTARYSPSDFANLPTAELRAWATRLAGVGQGFDMSGRATQAAHYGDFGLAMDYLQLARERPGLGRWRRFWNPAMAELRKTDAFASLVTDLGFVQAWRESGDWGDFCKPVSDTEINCH